MKKLCDILANTIAVNLSLNEDRKQVVAYGLLAVMQMLVISLSAVIIGLLFGFALETLFIFWGVGLLRKATGGAHAETLLGCTIMSIVSICLLAAFSRHLLAPVAYWQWFVAVQLCIYVFAAIVIYKKAPMDTPNKPIINPQKIRRLRKQSFLTLFVYAFLSTLLFFLSKGNLMLVSFSFSIDCAVLWQIFTLTKAGVFFISKGDALFRKQDSCV